MAPCRGILSPIEIGTAGGDVPSVLDTLVLFAMVIYSIVLLALRAFIEKLSSRMNRIDSDWRSEPDSVIVVTAGSSDLSVRGGG